jgi:hypothetical protein
VPATRPGGNGLTLLDGITVNTDGTFAVTTVPNHNSAATENGMEAGPGIVDEMERSAYRYEPYYET